MEKPGLKLLQTAHLGLASFQMRWLACQRADALDQGMAGMILWCWGAGRRHTALPEPVWNSCVCWSPWLCQQTRTMCHALRLLATYLGLMNSPSVKSPGTGGWWDLEAVSTPHLETNALQVCFASCKLDSCEVKPSLLWPSFVMDVGCVEWLAFTDLY